MRNDFTERLALAVKDFMKAIPPVVSVTMIVHRAGDDVAPHTYALTMDGEQDTPDDEFEAWATDTLNPALDDPRIGQLYEPADFPLLGDEPIDTHDEDFDAVGEPSN